MCAHRNKKRMRMRGVDYDAFLFGQWYITVILGGGMLNTFVTTNTKLNSVALVRERTIPTERPPPVGEVSANFCG